MSLGLAGIILVLCVVGGICCLRVRPRSRFHLLAGMLLLLVSAALTLYLLAAMLLVGAVD